METAYEYYTDEKRACVSSDEKKVVNHILALAKEYPNEVYISNHPGSNQGVIVAYIPRAWVKLPRPPKKISEEQRAKMSERMKNLRTLKKSDPDLDENESDE